MQSDNAKCYSSKELVFCIAALSFQHSVKLVRMIHTETQDGKSPLDGHFARAHRWILNWVAEGNNALTASHIVTALKSNGGLPNAGRSNDIYFIYPPNFPGLLKDSDFLSFIEIPQFSVLGFEYSGIGNGKRFDIYFHEKLVEINGLHDGQ